MKIAAALVKSKDHILTSSEKEFRVLSSERSGDMMWMITGYEIGGASRNMFVSPDFEIEVIKRDVQYAPEFG